MHQRNELTRCALALLAGIFLVSATQGCAVLGPSALSRGRAAYAEVIAETNAEQSLGLLVRLRYGAPWSLVAVSSVTANVRFNAIARGEIGVGPDASFAGALVPLSGGVAYEENPTISYLPVHGDKHLRQLLSPIPADLLVSVLNSSLDAGNYLALLVTSMNRIPNPAFVATPEAARDDRFSRVADLMGALSRAGALQFVPGLAGGKMTIRRARERPEHAIAATRFRDWWYYIDGGDLHGKRFFRIFEALLSARLADTVEGARTAPVLTVPVAR